MNDPMTCLDPLATSRRFAKVALVAALGLLAACTEGEVILPGEREDVRALEADALPLAERAPQTALPPLAIPAARTNTSWTHVSGDPTHLGQSLALSASPTRVWSTSIGEGNGKRRRVTAGPLVVGDVIYTLDAASVVTAMRAGGQAVWRSNLVPDGEGRDDTFGGGLAYGDGALVATTGYGEVLRLDPATGSILWRARSEGPFRAAPTLADGTVVAVARGDIAYGIDLQTGEVTWRVQGTGLGAGLVGGSAPAVRGPLAVLPFTSGEVTAVLVRNGLTVWNAAVTGGRRDLVIGTFDDISGDPVIDNDIVYAANQGGRMVAFDRRSGERLWTLRSGSYGPALPVGDSVFLVSDRARLLRVDARSGDVLWSVALPEWERPDRRRTAIAHFGPLLAGGRLLVASGDGLLRSFDPRTGAAVGSVEIPGGAAAQPAIANGRLYVVSSDGQLHAFQ